MSDEFVIRQPNDMYRRLNDAITGLEEHDDVDGAIKNIRMTLWRFDNVRDGAEFEEWLCSLFRHKGVQRIEVTDKFANIETTTSVVEGEVIETIVSELPDGVSVAGIIPGSECADGIVRAVVELKFPTAWNIDRRTIYHHSNVATDYRKGDKTYSGGD